MVFLVLIHGGREAASMPPKSLMKIRGLRSKIGKNECLLCCVDLLFHLVETLVRFFNKYAYVQIAVYGKGFNRSARDAWELFQSTGVESLVAYDCSGAVLLMGTILCGLITGTCAAVWTHFKWEAKNERMLMVGSTAMLMGMVLVGVAMVVVESAATSMYICYAEDPLLIHRWDAEFFNQLSETLHLRLRHRSARGREVLTQNRFDVVNNAQESVSL
ncbi:Protein PNS1 [Linum perenne]